MGTTRTEIFTAKQNKLAQILKALAHPARIAIIQYLVKSEICICGDLVEKLGLAQATISQHLKELKKIGVIKGCTEGTRISYCINRKMWQQVKKELDIFLLPMS
jgi:DNA-binding transcriptional ArsR family regulator